MKSILFLLSIAFTILPAAAQQPAKIELKPGDHIAILGNTLPDRMQHSAWFDTLVHAANPDKDLIIRNLAFAGDEVGTWHRVDDFGTRDEWLAKVGADVIIAFYGFNESFKGEAGIEKFKRDLDTFCKDMAKANFSGKGAPRMALVSPVAAEKHRNPDVADPAPINANLKRYVAAMAEVASANRVLFVDLFAASQQAYAEAKDPLTFNGIHLTVEGDRALAPGLFSGLFGEAAPNPDSYERLRQAIIERNAMWHSRYRTVDGYNVYGGRSGLAYAAGVAGFKQNEKNPAKPYVSNFQVMQQEMSVRDVMTANREKRVWAIAKGGDAKVDDSNVPPVEEVGTNLPVGSDTFNKTPMSGFKVDPKTGLVGFPSGEEVLAKLKVDPALKVQLFADEKMFPELVKPVQMGFDTKGRLWVSAWMNYPERTPWSKKGDSILIFEDTNADGRADKCTTFLDDLNCPTGFQFYKDGILVMRSPDLLWVRDVNGDDKPDRVERILSGLCAADSHHETNSMCYEPGGAVYCSDGVFHRSQIETPGGPVRNTDGCIYRYEPRTGRFERYAAYGFANPHGRVFDYWGNDIITDATGNANYYGPAFSGHIDEPSKHGSYNQFWARPSRPCPGTGILSSRHFPDDWNGNFLNANVISIQGIHRVKVTEDGSGLNGETITRKDGDKEFTTFIEGDPAEVGTFRPSCVAVSPDGSLFFADWSCAIIGHMQHHLRDPNRDHTTGRIYRVTYRGRPLLEPKKVHGQSIETLLELLKEPENDVRLRAKIELDKHDSGKVIAVTQQWAKQFDPRKVEDAHHILEALWVHQWHNVVNVDLIKTVLASSEPRARAQAVRVALYQRDRIPGVLDLIAQAAADENMRVRLEAVRACSFFAGADVPQAMEIAYSILKQPTDYYLDYCFKETLKQLQSLSKEKLLPTDPAVLATLLGKMDDKELDSQPGIEAVLLVKLERKSYDVAKREQIVSDLVKLRKTDRVSEIVAGLERLDVAGNDSAAAELAKLLVTSAAADLVKARPAVSALSEKAKRAPARRAAWAALIIANANAETTWSAASDTSKKQALVEAIALVPAMPNPTLRSAFQNHLAALLADLKVNGGLRKAALNALPLMGADHAAANFAVLAAHLKEGKERNAVATAMMQLPRTAWDKTQATELAKVVLAYAKSVPANRRSEQDYIEISQLGMELASLSGAQDLRKELRALGVAVFVVKTVREQLRFDTQRIVMEKGKPFEIIFENDDVMPHNLVVVDPGKHMEIGMAAQTMSPTDKDKEGRAFLPKGHRFIDATRLLEPGEKQRLQLRAPSREGEFEFVCTFPGHWMIMWGKLVVTKDVDAYLAANPTVSLPMPTVPPAAGK